MKRTPRLVIALLLATLCCRDRRAAIVLGTEPFPTSDGTYEISGTWCLEVFPSTGTATQIPRNALEIRCTTYTCRCDWTVLQREGQRVVVRETFTEFKAHSRVDDPNLRAAAAKKGKPLPAEGLVEVSHDGAGYVFETEYRKGDITSRRVLDYPATEDGEPHPAFYDSLNAVVDLALPNTPVVTGDSWKMPGSRAVIRLERIAAEGGSRFALLRWDTVIKPKAGVPILGSFLRKRYGMQRRMWGDARVDVDRRRLVAWTSSIAERLKKEMQYGSKKVPVVKLLTETCSIKWSYSDGSRESQEP